LARQLAHRCSVLDAERLFVAGLLADVGHLLMYQHDPVRSIQALAGANGNGDPLWQVERTIFGYDYAQVGAELFATWQLPHGLLETTRFHVTPSEAQQFPLETAIVHVSRVLTNIASVSRTIAREIQPRLDQDAMALVQLDPQDLETVSQEAARKSSEVLELIFPSARKAS
jgi:HD-like signal output (HDOD) protein